MKKSDLKNRMVVELMDGKRFLVIDGMLIGNDELWRELPYYNEDLTHYKYPDEDIVKVYPAVINKFLDIDTIDKWQCPIWERVREVTMEEVEEKFGCKVKIVKGEISCGSLQMR